MEPLSFDQVRVFLAVVDQGSFSGAARQLRRVQSAVSYAIANLEAQLQVRLFDRTHQRPVLTEAGRALLVDARKVAVDMDAMTSRARGLAQGLEPELALVVDVMFPMDRLVEALAEFGSAFPSVPPRLYVEALGAVAKLVLDGVCVLGITGSMPFVPEGLAREALAPVELVPVAAPFHPLAGQPAPLPAQVLREHVQLVLTDRSELTAGRDFSVLGIRTWRLADLGAKHAMLLRGLGWGNMPRHMVANDLEAGRLVLIWPAEWASAVQLLPMHVIHRADAALGPAARWLAAHLKSACAGARIPLSVTESPPAEEPLPAAGLA